MKKFVYFFCYRRPKQFDMYNQPIEGTQFNFGDDINHDLFQKIFKGNAVFTENKKICDFIGIGSILDGFIEGKKAKLLIRYINSFIKKDPIVHTTLGTGFIKESSKLRESYRDILNPMAIRGEITKARLEKNGVDCSNSILGDWGLIIDSIYSISQPTQLKKYDVGIIPHYIDQDHSFLNNIPSSWGKVKVINIAQPTEMFINHLLQCKTVISSAMHGLIAADSFGIPNLALKLGDKIVGGSYKFNDYYSIYDQTVNFLYVDDLLKIEKLSDYIISHYAVPSTKVKETKKQILECIKKNFNVTLNS